MYKNVTFNSSNNSAISVSVLLRSSDVLMRPVVSDIDIGCRKGIQPVKNWVVGCWHGYLFGARCWLAHGPADANATHCLFLQYDPGDAGYTGSPQVMLTILVINDNSNETGGNRDEPPIEQLSHI